MNPLYIIVPLMIIGAFEMIIGYYKEKEPKKKHPTAGKPKKGEIRKYVYLDEFEKSIS